MTNGAAPETQDLDSWLNGKAVGAVIFDLIGINRDGDLDLALQIIDARCGEIGVA